MASNRLSQLLPQDIRLAPKRRRIQKREDPLQIAIVASVRPRLRAIGGDILALNGEIKAGGGGKEWRFLRLQKERLASGYRPGQSDTLALWPMRQGVWVEIKVDKSEPDMLGHRAPRTYQNAEQKDFERFVKSMGWDYRVARSVSDYHAILSELGVPWQGG